MNSTTLRMKSGKKGVTPVIATIILIAGTLVLALVVGAYTFGLFGSNVKTVTLSSATLYGGTEAAALGVPASASSYIVFSLNNPGSASTITGITLTGSGVTAVTTWEDASGTSFMSNGDNNMAGGQVTSYTFYPFGTLQSLTTGQVFNYVISFANGQSVSGSLIAQ
jgi:flagellin-like protein